MKRYDSYKDSGVQWIGDIPSKWECIRLGMLGTFSSSGIDKKSKENETPVRMVNYTDLIKSRRYYPIQTGDKEYMRVTTPQSKFEEHKLERGDMVFIPSSETHEDLGYSSLIDFDEDDIVYSYHILRYKTKKPVFHYFKKYLINHHSILNQFSSECKGTTRQIIGRDVFNNVRVVLPPLSEQQKIVSFLEKKTSLIDSLIEKTQRKIELLKEKRTSLVNDVVTKGLNPNVEMKDSGVEWIGQVPSHWGKSKLKYKGVFFSGYSFDSNDFLSEGDVRVLKISNVQNNGISWDDLQYLPESFYHTHQNFIVNKGDLVFVLTRPIISTGIKVCFFNEEHKTLLNQRNSVFRPNESLIIKRFLFYSVRTFSFIEEFKQQLKETNQPNISTEQISNILMFYPPLNEQEQIVEYLDEQTQLIDKTVSIEEKRIKLLEEYRQSLISEVVTGKRKVV